jgi:hypothetical protein
MNLVKWFRKNKTKVMAIVVIVLMIAFIGGSALNYMLSPARTLGSRVVAYYGNNRKITSNDLTLARREVEVLKLLGASELIRQQDLRGFLMAELLFSEGKAQTPVINQIRQVIRANRYSISDEQIACIYSHSMPSHVYWLLLKNEAQLAGIRITNDDVGELLARAIPQLFDGQTYTQRIKWLINQYGIPEHQLLATFGKLVAALQYTLLISSTEDVTDSQIVYLTGCEKETIDVEFVKFDSDVFTEAQAQPSEEQILEHFNKYKDSFAGEVSQDNPYGFGYKLPDRVQLEYIALKLDDISPIVTPPTPQETEEYYRKRIKQFTESVPQDPNDPNSPLVERTRSYAEMETFISKQLLRDKINSKAESILQEARTQTEIALEDLEPEKLSAEQLTSVADEGSGYETVAKKLAEKHNIKVYAGQTDLLSASDMGADECLSRLYMLGEGRNPVRLRQILFSIPSLSNDEQSASGGPARPSPLGGGQPRLFENIGPARDLLSEIMVLVRITKAQKTSTPENIDLILDTRTLMLDDDKESKIEQPVLRTVRENVVDDLKKLAVVRQGLVKNKAEELIDLVKEDGWEKALNKFNELYSQQTGQSESDPNVFRLERLTNLQRIPKRTLTALAAQSKGRLAEQIFVNEAQKRLTVNEAEIQSQLIDKLYSLVPRNSSVIKNLPLAMEFKPQMCVYIIKDILVKRLGLEEYEKMKAMQFYSEVQAQSQTMAAVHFNPENIVKRMNFRPAKQDQTQAESGVSDESEGAS